MPSKYSWTTSDGLTRYGGPRVAENDIQEKSIDKEITDSAPGENWTSYNRDSVSSDPGVVLTAWSGATIVANGTPSSGAAGVVTTDLAPVRSDRAIRLIGDASIRASVTSTFTAINSDARSLRSIAVWLKIKGRTQPHATLQVYLGNGVDPYTGKALATSIATPSDGKWHLVVLPVTNMSVVNAFVVGTDTIQSIGIRDRNGAGLGVTGMLTNAEELQIGPVYLNPWSRPKFLIRMDDSLAEVVRGGVSFTADGINKQWTHLDLLTQFGFRNKGTIFHLTRRIGTSTNKDFLTRADLKYLSELGWSHCAQSHQDPVSGDSMGVRLMGPDGFTAKAVSSVDTSANTITASAVHNINTSSGYWGCPVQFSGTDLPSPLVTGVVYWARNTSTTAFTLHNSENDSIANVNAIDLTTTGTPANFTFRYGFSANDYTLVKNDIATCINQLKDWGYHKTASVWAPNQGAIDFSTFTAALEAGVSLVCLVGGTGSSYDRPFTRHPNAITTGSSSSPGATQPLFPGYVIPSAVQTDGSITEAQIKTYIDGVIACGGIGSNYHHGLSAGANANQLIAYLDHLRLRVREGACDVITAEELVDYLAAARSTCIGVSL